MLYDIVYKKSIPFKVEVDGKTTIFRKFRNDQYTLVASFVHSQVFREKNDILIHVSGEEYVYIGKFILRFLAKSPIAKFYSTVSEDGIMWPYAIDGAGNYYLLLDGAILSKYISGGKWKNPYEYYNSFREVVNPGILKAYPGPLFYYPNAKMSYKNGIRIKTIVGKKMKLTLPSYVRILKNYGKQMGFAKISGIKILGSGV